MSRTPRFATAFGERNTVVIALVGLLVMAVVFLLTFNAASLPVIGGGQTYRANFTEAGGLKQGNEVRVAGVKVGEVTDISLDGSTVVVTFRAKDVKLGDETTAAVKVKTLLGQKFLSLDPLGRGELTSAIPTSRTTTPYDVNEAFSDLSTTIDDIDTPKLEQSLTTLADTFRDTPESVRNLVSGLTDLSRTFSTRDAELGRLLEATTQVTGTLKNRNDEIASIITDGSTLLGELQKRREAIRQMLEGTARLGTQITGLVKDNEARLRPALAQLDQVSQILQRNQAQLDATLAKLGPYYRTLASATGNGRWIDAYVCGLFGTNGRAVLDNDVVRDCAPQTGGGR